MLLSSLRLSYFFSHEDEEIVLLDADGDVIEGIFLLSGESESGKSTFIDDAICFALYGARATRVTAFDLTQRDLRTRSASDEDETRVEATFAFPDGSVMGVTRTITAKGSATAEVWEVRDGRDVVVAQSVQAADRYVADRLGGLSRRQLPNSFVARQEEIDALASLQGAERRKAVHSMLGVTEVEIARKENAQRLRSHELRLNQLDAKLQGRTLQGEQAELDAARAASAQADERLATQTDRAAQLTAARVQAASDLAAYETAQTLRSRIERGQQALSALDERADTLRARVQAHQEAASLAGRRDELQAASDRAGQRLEELSQAGQRVKSYRAKRADLDAAVERRAALVPAQASVAVAELPTPEELRATLRDLAGERGRLELERDERQGHLARLRGSGECYVCQRSFDSHDDHAAVLSLVQMRLEAIDERLLEIADEHTSATQLLPRAQAAADEAARVHRDLISADAQIDQLRQQLDQIAEQGRVDDDVDDLRARWQEARQQSDQASAALAGAVDASRRLDADAVDQLAALQSRRQEYTTLLEKLSAELEGLDVDDPARAAQLAGELSSLDHDLAAVEGSLAPLRAAAADARARLEAHEKTFEAFHAELTERDRHHEQALKHARMADLLEGFTESLVNEIRPTLEQLASELLVKATDGRRTAIRLDEDYNISVQDADGEWYSGSSLSGGAKARAAICLRLALTRLVSQRTGVPIRFLVMDEPLGAQDQTHVDFIMDMLDGLRGVFPQIFIISHGGDLHANEHVDYVMRFQPAPGKRRVKLTYA